MADLILKGPVAKVQLSIDPSEGTVWAACIKHGEIKRPDRLTLKPGDTGCIWIREYDDLRDAVKYAADHADTGRQDA